MAWKVGGVIITLIAIAWVAVWGLHELEIIDRLKFTWEAFATLMTGGLAVAGAAWIGIKQVGITERQANITERQSDIAARQVKLELLTLQSQLYDRRIVIFKAVKDYMAEQWGEKMEPDQAVSREFYLALESSAFLFGPDVQQKMRDLHTKMRKHFAYRRVVARAEKRNDVLSEDEINSGYSLIDGVTEDFETLTNLIMRYMRLDEHSADL